MHVVIGDGQDGAVVEQRQHHDHHRRQRIKVEDQDRQRHEQQHAQRLGDAVDRVAVHPLEDLAALLDRVDDHRQAGRHQHDGRRRARRVGRARNGDAAVGLLQRGGVIHPVAGHADDVAALLQDIDDVELVFGEDLGETVGLLDGLGQLPPSLDASSSPRPLASRMFVPIPSFLAVSLAMASASPVTILTFTPICRAVAMVALASSAWRIEQRQHTKKLPFAVCRRPAPRPMNESRAPRIR